MDDKKKQLLNKLKALAERGVGGEKETAQRKLQELMEKYEIDENDLSDDKKEKYQFKYKNEFEKKLIKQIAYRTFKKEWSERMYTYSRGRGKRSIMLIECTKAEEIQLRIEGSCKKDHYRMEEQDLKRMAMMEMLLQDKTMTKMLENDEKRWGKPHLFYYKY